MGPDEATQDADALRKQREREFHDHHREGDDHRANKKFYVVSRLNNDFVRNWLRQRVGGKRVLDYGCGDGTYSTWLAHQGADAYGIDISPVSVANGTAEAEREGVGERVHLSVMDAEAMEFPDNHFDYVVVNGVLHHLKLSAAYAELARVLKPDGEIIAVEGLRHNVLINTYRRRTPQLRTEWESEHILGRQEIEGAAAYFGRVDVHHFHLLTIASVPFRNTRVFDRLLQVLAAGDRFILRLPGIRWQSWMAVFVLADPRKPAPTSP